MARRVRHDTKQGASINRALGGTEKIYWLLDQLYCLNFAVYAEIEGTLSQSAIRNALEMAQQEHPLLRARIEVTGRKPVFASADPRSARLVPERRELRGWRRQLERELDRPFGTGTAPLARFLWFRGEAERSVAALVFHHPIADGRSGASVLTEVLRRAAGEELGLDYRQVNRASQDLDVIKRKRPLQANAQMLRFWLNRGKETLAFARQLPGYDMRVPDARDVRSLPVSVPAKTSAALLANCRREKTSIHGALGAALLFALNAEHGPGESRNLALNSLADLRGVLVGDLSERDLGLYVATLTTVHEVGPGRGFWEVARELRAALREVLDSGDGNLIHSFYPESILFTPDRAGARKVQKVVALAPPSSMLTNIGDLGDVSLGTRARLRAMGFLLSPPAQNPVCVTAASYRGRMSLNLLYDQGKLRRTQASRIARNFRTILTDAAGPQG